MGFIDTILSYIKLISVIDVIDVAIVAFAVYKIIGYARETRISQLLKGIVILLVVTQLSAILKLNTISFILQNFMQFGFLALIVVFQPELRRILESMGTGSWRKLFFRSKSRDDEEAEINDMIENICRAVSKMSMQRVGALIVFERRTFLQDTAKTGTIIDAKPSSELIQNIFYPKSPLHDGAVIISEQRILSAGCILPLSNQRGINKELGTRHRAALGISENSDAVVVIVSEENGMISFVQKGIMSRNLTVDRIGDKLRESLIEVNTETVEKHKKLWENITKKEKKEDNTKDD